MKKIFWLLITFLSAVTVYHAETLNLRANMLTFNSYEINEQNEIFVIYTNNLTDKIMYSLNPYHQPENLGNYEKIGTKWSMLELATQNKIKKAIAETQNAEEFATQMYFYIHTQMLIWQTFHPEIPIYLGPEVGSFVGNLEKYRKEFEERINQKPEWIKDYEIKETLILPKDNNYIIESTDCQLKMMEDEIHIFECAEESTLTITEKIEDTIYFYSKEESEIIESGLSPQTWQIKLSKPNTQLSPPSSEDDPTKPIIPDKNTEEENPHKNNNEEKEELVTNSTNNVHILKNVPNTFENVSLNPFSYFILILGFLWRKKHL